MADNVVDSLAIEIEANASQSVDGIKRLSRALTSLATSTAKVNSAGLGNVVSQVQRLSSVTTSAGTGATNASNGTRKYSNALNLLTSSSGRAEKSTKSLAYYFGKIYANCFLAIRGFKAIGNAIEYAMDYLEGFNFFDVVINTAAEKTDQWKDLGYKNASAYAKALEDRLGDTNEKLAGIKVDNETGDFSLSNVKNLGLDITKLQTFQAEIISTSNSLGIAAGTSYKAADGFAKLTGDMSSLKNVDLSKVMNDFQSGLLGQSRALYKYGIDTTNANLQTYAYANGVSKAVSEMTQGEKWQLRTLAILDQSKEAWGDLANTISQPANQLRMFTTGVQKLALTIGKVLMPMVTTVLPYLNALVMAMQRFVEWIANIAGIELKSGNTGIGKNLDSIENVGEDADNAKDSVDNLTNSVKALNKQLAPFDELNNLTTSSSGGGKASSGNAGTGDTIDLSDAISKAFDEYSKIWDEAYQRSVEKAQAMADTIVDAFKRKDYKGIGTYISNGLTNALNSIPWKTIYSVASEFGSGFAEFLNGLITPDLFYSVGKTIASALNTAIYTSLSFATTFDWGNLGESIAAGVNGFFENFDFKALGKAVNKWVKGIKKMIITAIKNIKWSDVFKAIYDFLSELDVDTITIIIGAFAIKYAGKLLTSSIFKELLVEKLLGSGITASGIVSGAAAALTIGAVIAVSIQLVKDTNDWMNYLGADNLWDALTNKKYDDKKKEYADKNPANPYENGRALSDSDMEDIENSIKDWWQGVTDWWTGTTLYRFITNPTEMLEGAKSGLSTAWDNLTSDFKDWTFDVSAQLTTTAENVQEWWGNVKEWWGDKKVSVQSTIDNFKQKISDKWNDAKQWWDNSRPHLSDVKAAVDDFKERVGEKWNTAKQWWDNNKPDLNEIKSKIESVKDRVSGAWKSTTDWWGRKTSLSQIKTTMESVSQRVREKWNEAKAWWSSKSPLKTITSTVENISSKVRDKWESVKSYWRSKSPLSNITASVSDFVASVRDKWNNLYSWWSSLRLPNLFANITLPHLSVSWHKSGAISIPSFNVEYYAKGGFPDAGATFVAGEAGAEMVGKINGKTGVASNQEITGIRDAVYDAGEAQLAELREQNSLLRQLLAKDMGISTRDVFNAVRQEDENYENMTGHSAFVR